MPKGKRIILNAEQTAQVNAYSELMQENGYTEQTIKMYISAVSSYLQTGLPLTAEEIKKYFEDMVHQPGMTSAQKNRLYSMKSGTMRFYELITGDKKAIEKIKGHLKRYNRKSCNKDCFNCIYPDCIY